jgi:uncharacterized coiled-coil DUF342 family protein
MDELKQELKNILEEREKINDLREQWKAKWEKLEAQTNQNNINLVVLQKELESINQRVRAWQQRRMKYESDIKEITTMIRQTIPKEIH